MLVPEKVSSIVHSKRKVFLGVCAKIKTGQAVRKSTGVGGNALVTDDSGPDGTPWIHRTLTFKRFTKHEFLFSLVSYC